MKIIVDVMSGDKAPGEIIKGACFAAKTGKTDIIMVGNSEVIEKYASENMLDISLANIEIADARDVITMEDDPMSVKDKKESSMATALRLLREGKGEYAVPAEIKDLSHFPETYIEVEEYDALKDEAINFAEKLRDAGIHVQLKHNRRCYHGFDYFKESPTVKKAKEERLRFLSG